MGAIERRPPAFTRSKDYLEEFSTCEDFPQPTIGVACTNPTAGTGHPVAGQSVEVQEVLPPSTAASPGYTGNFGVEINASLVYTQAGVVAEAPVATFLDYARAMAIPTSITVPCSGGGVMNFAPSPNPDQSGVPSNVDVTFRTTVVVGG